MAKVDGYKQKAPDADWWIAQIEAGIRRRKKETYQHRHNEWRSWYRGEWPEHIMPVNLFFMMARSLVPRLYFRNPSITISPGKPGFDHLLLAKGLENIDNKLMRSMEVKRHMKKTIQDTFLFGTGIPKLGFGGLYGHEIPSLEGLEDVEYIGQVRQNMPWFRSVDLSNIILPPEASSWWDARWYAERVVRPLSDVRADTRLDNRKGVQPNREERRNDEFRVENKHEVKLALLYEVHDRKTGKVFILAPDHSEGARDAKKRVLLFEDDIMQIYGGVPYFPLVFNPNDDRPWGVPDSKILEPFQLEINETRTQIAKHRRATIVKIIAAIGKITQEEAEKMVSEDSSAVVFASGDVNRAVKVMQALTIPKEFFLSNEMTMQDVRETVGFSRNQFGEFNSRTADTTATEAQIVKAASEVRIDERRDEIADALTKVVNLMHPVIFDNWGIEEVVEMVGPGGIPVWVEISRDILAKGRWSVKVDPETAVPETRALRERRAQELYLLLKENPLIDPIKLTQYLLYELRGSSFDDMMKALPMPTSVPNGAVPIGEFANMVQGGMQQAAGSVGALERLFGAPSTGQASLPKPSNTPG